MDKAREDKARRHEGTEARSDDALRLPLRARYLAILTLLFLLPLTLLGQAAKSSVSIKNGFDPATITIHAGDSITWTNDSDSDQDVTADDNSFSSGNLKSGKAYSHTFSTAGKFPYGCSIHPRERGTVVVEK